MVTDTLTRMRERLDTALSECEEYTGRDDFNSTDPAYLELRATADSLGASYQSLVELRQRRAEADSFTANLSRVQSQQSDTLSTRTDDESLSLGEAFVRSDVYKGYPFGGTTSRTTLRTRALPSALADWADALPPPPKRDVTPPVAPTTLLSLIPSVPVSGNSVETIVYSRVTGTGAEVVAEKGTKPLIEFKPTVTPVVLQNIAAATQLTRQLLEDAPAVRARIDTMLANEVRMKQESEAAAALVAATLPTATAASLLAAIRVGIATVQTAGYNPTAVLLNPEDWADIDNVLLTSTLNGPVVNQRFFGLTPVAHAAQAAGTATVGDFNAGVENYTRSGISAYITDSHAETFLENVFTILAEVRSKTVVVRPNALVEVSVGS